MRTFYLPLALTVTLTSCSPSDMGVADRECDTTRDGEWCVPVFACLGDEGRSMVGRTYGRITGTVSGATDYGHLCTGTWDSNPDRRSGDVSISCADGQSLEATFRVMEQASGSSIASGYTARGDRFIAWSGEYVRTLGISGNYRDFRDTLRQRDINCRIAMESGLFEELRAQ
jgi:hypothetical protein